MKSVASQFTALLVRAEAGEQIEAIYLLSMGFTVPQYFALGGRDVVCDGRTWQALDIAMSDVEESASDRNGLRFSFPAVTESELALALAEDVEGTPVELFLALIDPDTNTAYSMSLWAGELDQPGWQDGPEALLNFTAEHLQDIAARPKPSRYTDDEQRRLYPGDTFFAYDPATDAPELVWPAASYFKV